MKPKIAFIVPIVAHYRLSFFERLINNNPEFEWCVFHGIKRKEDGRPAYSGEINFPNKIFTPKIFKIYPFGIVYNKALFSDIKDFNPDMVITTGISGDISNRQIIKWINKRGKTCILWVCSWESGNAKGLFKVIKSTLIKSYFRKATHFIAYGTHAKNYIESFGIEPKRISIAFNGIDLNVLKQNETRITDTGQKIRLKQCKSSNDFIFLYVGGLISEKRVDLLVSQFIKLNIEYNSAKLWIIGDGPLLNRLVSIAGNNTNVTFFGRIINDVDPYFVASDCFVLPGAGGLALNQAMYWKKTCIAGFADGTEEDLVVEGLTGFRFIQGDGLSLYHAMEKAVNLPLQSRIKFGETARKIIEEQSNVDRMLEVFQSVVRKIW